MFLVNQQKGEDSVRQAQLARAILNMIAEDVRTTVRHQAFDSSGLEQMLDGDAGGSAMGGAGAGSASTGSSGAPPTGSTGTTGSSAGPATGGAGSSSTSADSTTGSTQEAPLLPPGIYGTATSIEIDICRLPRPDEYYPQMSNSTTGAIGDMPSDIKTIGYYVQSPRTDGVQDPLATLTQEQTSVQGTTTAPTNGGLVRRSVDRAVTQYAYSMGLSDQLLRTGQIVSPDVLAVEFQYFDGTTWQIQWDGSQQGLPHVVKITIAMQRESFSKSNPMAPGISLSSLTAAMMQEYGIEIFATNTIIPGAQLLVAPQGTSATGSTDSGMSSLGL